MSETERIDLELPKKPPQERGRWQFSLASLFRMMTLMGLVLGLPGVVELLLQPRVREERMAVRLRGLGWDVLPPQYSGCLSGYPFGWILDHWYPGIGSLYVERHPEEHFWKLPSDLKDAYRLDDLRIVWRGKPAPGLAELQGVSSLRSVELQGDCFDVRQFLCLEKCPSLEQLELHGDGIDDEILACVARITQLRELTLTAHGYTEKGLGSLASLANLRSLCIENDADGLEPALSDDALAYIAQIPRLEQLELMHTKITGTGLHHLSKLKQLRTLVVYVRELRAEGQAALRSLTWVTTKDIRVAGAVDPAPKAAPEGLEAERDRVADRPPTGK